jgi:hypothetical protein
VQHLPETDGLVMRMVAGEATRAQDEMNLCPSEERRFLRWLSIIEEPTEAMIRWFVGERGDVLIRRCRRAGWLEQDSLRLVPVARDLITRDEPLPVLRRRVLSRQSVAKADTCRKRTRP